MSPVSSGKLLILYVQFRVHNSLYLSNYMALYSTLHNLKSYIKYRKHIYCCKKMCILLYHSVSHYHPLQGLNMFVSHFMIRQR